MYRHVRTCRFSYFHQSCHVLTITVVFSLTAVWQQLFSLASLQWLLTCFLYWMENSDCSITACNLPLKIQLLSLPSVRWLGQVLLITLIQRNSLFSSLLIGCSYIYNIHTSNSREEKLARMRSCLTPYLNHWGNLRNDQLICYNTRA